jgi:hypothetical protein
MLQSNLITNLKIRTPKLEVGLCNDEHDLKQYQRLRYAVYENEFGFQKPSAVFKCRDPLKTERRRKPTGIFLLVFSAQLAICR